MFKNFTRDDLLTSVKIFVLALLTAVKIFVLAVVVFGTLTIAVIAIINYYTRIPSIEKMAITDDASGLVVLEEYISIKDTVHYQILLHKESGTLYLNSKNSGITQMLGENGLPLIVTPDQMGY